MLCKTRKENKKTKFLPTDPTFFGQGILNIPFQGPESHISLTVGSAFYNVFIYFTTLSKQMLFFFLFYLFLLNFLLNLDSLITLIVFSSLGNPRFSHFDPNVFYPVSRKVSFYTKCAKNTEAVKAALYNEKQCYSYKEILVVHSFVLVGAMVHLRETSILKQNRSRRFQYIQSFDIIFNFDIF